MPGPVRIQPICQLPFSRIRYAGDVNNIPTVFQRRMLWTAITALAVTVMGALLVGVIYLGTRIISFLQPLLIPFAVAAVMAYLLNPVVSLLMRWKLSRHRAVLVVFTIALIALVGVGLSLRSVAVQSVEFAKEVPGYVKTAQSEVLKKATVWNEWLKKKHGLDLLHWSLPQTGSNATPPSSQQPTASTPSGVANPEDATPEAATTHDDEIPPKDDAEAAYRTLQDLLSGEWVKPTLSYAGFRLWGIIHSSVGGFLGVFGFLLSLVIVPLYLYYFLTESPKIAETWSHYVPLRASDFKNEVVDTLEEINRYLIAFFRGQLVVSLINGIATGVGLVIVGLKFGWLIGLSLCLLGMIPYLGIVICWVPAVIIASVQGGSYLIPTTSPWWVFPLVVTGIFGIVQQIDGLFITPKIVGQSVGLHPMTVIVAVFAWSLIMGGLLGAILAVPLTAALKVLFQRYVWKRTVEPRLRDQVDPSAAKA